MMIWRKIILVWLCHRRVDLIGKKKLGAALDEVEEKAAVCACYMAFVPWKAYQVLEKKLQETGQAELFHQIEMPLIYSLFHMEQAGIRVEREALSVYGKKLKEKIRVLEQEIYEDAGENFNINSPKQLGEVLFDHMKLPHGKKTKTGYSTAQMCWKNWHLSIRWYRKSWITAS